MQTISRVEVAMAVINTAACCVGTIGDCGTIVEIKLGGPYGDGDEDEAKETNGNVAVA